MLNFSQPLGVAPFNKVAWQFWFELDTFLVAILMRKIYDFRTQKIYTKLIHICDHIPTNEYHYLFLGRSSINLFSTFTISFKHVVKMTLIYTQMPNFTQK